MAALRDVAAGADAASHVTNLWLAATKARAECAGVNVHLFVSEMNRSVLAMARVSRSAELKRIETSMGSPSRSKLTPTELLYMASMAGEYAARLVRARGLSGVVNAGDVIDAISDESTTGTVIKDVMDDYANNNKKKRSGSPGYGGDGGGGGGGGGRGDDGDDDDESLEAKAASRERALREGRTSMDAVCSDIKDACSRFFSSSSAEDTIFVAAILAVGGILLGRCFAESIRRGAEWDTEDASSRDNETVVFVGLSSVGIARMLSLADEYDAESALVDAQSRAGGVGRHTYGDGCLAWVEERTKTIPEDVLDRVIHAAVFGMALRPGDYAIHHRIAPMADASPRSILSAVHGEDSPYVRSLCELAGKGPRVALRSHPDTCPISAYVTLCAASHISSSLFCPAITERSIVWRFDPRERLLEALASGSPVIVQRGPDWSVVSTGGCTPRGPFTSALGDWLSLQAEDRRTMFSLLVADFDAWKNSPR
jgi:hypothetical protein